MARPTFERTPLPMETPPSALTLQMLAWIDERPRTYEETMEAWKTSCPRLSIYEDALSDGLIGVATGGITLTEIGKKLLERQS